MGVFYAYPLLSMLSRAVYDHGWSLSPFAGLLADSAFWRVLGVTGQIAAFVTLLCLLLAFPLAYWLARMRASRANLLLILVLIPFWTSVLVRTYAWMSLLGRRGVVNAALQASGVIEAPLQMMNTRFAVCLAMVHVLLPFTVLPLFATLRNLDWGLVRAAASLGASPAGAFRQVVLPLAMPGLVAGCLVTFTLTIGFYITPVLVGAGSDIMISMLIGDLVGRLDWSHAAAMATVLLLVVLAALLLAARLVPLGRVFGGVR